MSGSSEPSKPSTSKTVKKSKIRNKITKNTNQTLNENVLHNLNPKLTTNEPSKNKTSHRNFAGFGPKSVKIFWEQYDNNDTEVTPDVFSSIAEDITYKVWELISTIKNYARHCGGEITCDIVNDVLRDSNVPPILGAEDIEWDKIEYDGTFYFNQEQIIQLRDEYLNEIEPIKTNSTQFSSSWALERNSSKDLVEFAASLCNPIFIGNDEAHHFALEAAAYAPAIGCCLKSMFKKCIEILAFKQKPEIVKRCLNFLCALSWNPKSRDSECDQELYHLAELLTCLLIGSYDNIKIYKFENSMFDKTNNIRSSKEEEIKDAQTQMKMEVDNLSYNHEKKIKLNHIENSNNDINNLNEIIDFNFSPYKAEMSDSNLVDLICHTMGLMGSKFGYFQNECIFNIQKRVEKYFISKISKENLDYEFIRRSVKGLICLGEVAFRELIPFFPQIDPQYCPEKIYNDFSIAASFLRGRSDIFVYEWLEDLCGDKLQPFLLYFNKFKQKYTTEVFKNKRKPTFKIFPKILLKRLDKRKTSVTTINDAFPNLIISKSYKKQIGFHFAGCRPVILKRNSTQIAKNLEQKSLNYFNSKTTIARRKILKPLINGRKFVCIPNYNYLSI